MYFVNDKKTLWYITKYFAPKTPSSPGGRGWLLLNELAKSECDVVVISSNSNNLIDPMDIDGSWKDETVNNIRLIWLNTLKYGVAKSYLRILSWFHFELKLFFYNKKNLPRPDAVVVSSLSLLTILNGLWLKRKYQCRLIFEIRDIWPLTIIEEGGASVSNPMVRFLGWLERLGYRKSDAIIGTMPNLAEHVQGVCKNSAPVFCVPMGVSLDQENNDQPLSDEYKSRILNHTSLKIVHAGTIGITNALETLFETAKLLEDDDRFQFIIVGDGALREAYIEKYSYLKNVTFAPKVSKNQVQSVLSECDIVYFSTFPSKVWRYGQSLNKVIDYMLSGKPVVASYSGYPSMINEAQCGQFVPASNPQALADTFIKYAAMSEAERLEMGAKGKAWLLHNRNYKKLAQDFSKVVFGE